MSFNVASKIVHNGTYWAHRHILSITSSDFMIMIFARADVGQNFARAGFFPKLKRWAEFSRTKKVWKVDFFFAIFFQKIRSKPG